MTNSIVRKFSPLILVALLLSAFAAGPVGAETQPPPPPPSQSVNQDLGTACGLDLAIVLDRSGSMLPAGSTVKAAANAFLDTLKDTGSTVSLASFAGTSSPNKAPAALTTANLSSFLSAVNLVTFNGSTNWEAGLLEAQGQFAAFPGGKPDLVIMITDGNPNKYNSGSGTAGLGSGFVQTAQDHAVLVANAIRDAGVHMFALGIQGTDPIKATALQAISGPDQFPTPQADFAKADWTSASYAGLSDALHSIATALCEQTVVVHKVVNGQPAAGFEFNAPGQDPVVTDANGTAAFTWKAPQGTQTTVSESPRAGYVLDSIECVSGNETVGGPKHDNGIDLSVGPRQRVDCTFTNVALTAGIHIVKSGPDQAHELDEVTYSFKVSNTGEMPLYNVLVTDNVLGTIGTIDFLPVGGDPVTLKKTWPVPGGQNADVVNVATACGSVQSDSADRAICDTARHTLDVLHPNLRLEKTADPMTVTAPGDVTYTYVVTNNGDIVLKNVSVDDDILGAIGSIGSLDPGESKTFHKTVTVNADSPVRNVATADGTDPLGEVVHARRDLTITIVEAATTTTTKPPTTTTTVHPTTTTTAAPVTPAIAPTQVLGVQENRTELPRTGYDPRGLLLAGALLLISGLAVRAGNRRARKA